MNRKIFLGLILTSIIVISLIALTGCVDPQKNPTIPSYNTFPRLGELTLYPAMINSYCTTTLSVVAKDDDGDDLKITFREEQNRGSFQITSSTMAIWTAPLAIGNYNIYVKVEDPSGAAVEGYKTLLVINHPPTIDSVVNTTANTANPILINYNIGDTSLITIIAHDTDGGTVSPVSSDIEVTEVWDQINNVSVLNSVTCAINLQSTSTPNTVTTMTHLFSMNADALAPLRYLTVYLDISVIDNLGNTKVNTPVFTIVTFE